MFDFEDVLNNLQSILVNNLNDYIDAINSVKADSITLPNLDTSAFIMQSMDERAMNFDPFCFFGIVDMESIVSGPSVAEDITIALTIVATDDGTGNDMTKKMFRFQRVLKNLIKDKWQSGGISNRFEVNSLLPATITGLDDTQMHRIAGIEIKTTIS